MLVAYLVQFKLAQFETSVLTVLFSLDNSLRLMRGKIERIEVLHLYGGVLSYVLKVLHSELDQN